MNVYRYEENPLVTPGDVNPHRDDFEVIGAFNAGIARYKDEVIMLLRVAERPVSDDPTIVKAPVFNTEKMNLKSWSSIHPMSNTILTTRVQSGKAMT